MFLLHKARVILCVSVCRPMVRWKGVSSHSSWPWWMAWSKELMWLSWQPQTGQTVWTLLWDALVRTDRETCAQKHTWTHTLTHTLLSHSRQVRPGDWHWNPRFDRQTGDPADSYQKHETRWWCWPGKGEKGKQLRLTKHKAETINWSVTN